MQMKKSFRCTFLLVILLLTVFVTGCGNNSTGSSDGNSKAQVSKDTFTGKTLIIYYSYSGTTKRVAEHLQQLTNGELYELTLKEPYTGSSNDVSDRVFAERDDKKMPELSGELLDISKYDRILIGTPVWNDSMSNPVAGYLEQADFNGKTVAPFWTYITNQGTTKKEFENRIKNGNVKTGLPIASANGLSDSELDKKLSDWLKQEVQQ